MSETAILAIIAGCVAVITAFIAYLKYKAKKP